MTRSARLAGLLLAVVPACSVLALDPTLPQPGKGGRPSTPPASVKPASPQPGTAAAQPPAAPDATPIEATPADRQPIPDKAAITEAAKLVDQVYQQDLAAARLPDQKKALAVKFRQTAAESRPPGQYVLLGRSRELAADAGDVDTTFGAVADLERAFVMDASAFEIDSVNRLLRVVRTVDGMRSIVRHLLGSANQAVAGNRFESAKKLIDLAVSLSARINDPAMARIVLARSKEVREIEAAYPPAKPALDAVAAKSADPAQNLAAGRYLALYQGNFAAGVPLLAAGTDDPLKNAAVKETAGADDAAAQDAIGDAWWAISEKLTGVAKNHAMVHAGSFYAKAAPSLSGLQQAKAAKRAKEAEPLAAMYVGRPASSQGQSAVAAASGSTGNASPGNPPPATGSGTPAAGDGPKININLPQKFVRVWKTPEVWANKPEVVTLKGDRVSIVNEGGANTVCENEPLVPQKDGSLVLSWDYGVDKTGYEIWSVKDGELHIQRWNSKAELDGGREVRRIGTMVK